ncbi:MAG: helix-turn-helix transcriptional regulator [Candidatus Gastranaerophilaceae bacterium]|uniref:Helix-turn-helix transcriptional regulator n=1 Tax=Candidatus Limenecus avicola TaxID=2840847 RepID=A0A9D1SRB7_9CLOT|nr:xre family DNA-binding protein [Clostridium sp. CAG:306]HIU91946.1 helix-turn-helix transcriptional regulator [Candidatus Limenecus avicola]
MTNIKKLLGKKIKFYREKADLTQEQLAEKISINSRSLSLIERGNNFITAETLSSIAEALNVTPKKLFDFDDEFVDPKITKEKLFDLINKNEDKIQTIYNIVKGYLN